MRLLDRIRGLFTQSGTVLVIEDDPIQRLWIQRTVRVPGIKVIVPDTSDDLIDIIGIPVDLLVLDRHMENGWGVAKAKALEYYRGQCPIWEHTVDSSPSDDPIERKIVKCDPSLPTLTEQIKEWFAGSTPRAGITQTVLLAVIVTLLSITVLLSFLKDMPPQVSPVRAKEVGWPKQSRDVLAVTLPNGKQYDVRGRRDE